MVDAMISGRALGMSASPACWLNIFFVFYILVSGFRGRLCQNRLRQTAHVRGIRPSFCLYNSFILRGRSGIPVS